MGMLGLYIDYFRRRLKNLWKLKKEIPVDFEEIVEEQWHTDFSGAQDCRFVAETGDGYTASFKSAVSSNSTGGLALEAQRRYLYAWTVNPVFRYKNVIIDAEIYLPKPAKKLETFAASADLRYDLVCFYQSTKRFEQAQTELEKLKRYETSERVEVLERTLTGNMPEYTR